MADHLKQPPNAQVNSTESNLGRGPEGMPSWGGKQGQAQVTSTQVPLATKESRVAQFGAHPSQGQAQITSSMAELKRTSTSPYEHISRENPQVSFEGKAPKV